MKTLSRAAVFAAIVFTVLTSRIAFGQLQLADLFADHMVLQRDGRAALWGMAEPSSQVTLSLLSDQSAVTIATAAAKAGVDGRWIAAFQGLKAGGPFELSIANGNHHVIFHDVLVGDVWLCSGQSNMEYQLRDPAEIAIAPDPLLRYFIVPRAYSLEPTKAIKAGAHWVSASAETRGTFTAVGYYFGKRLRQEVNIPIGLINASWGGTPAEVWMSKQAVDEIPEFRATADSVISSMRTIDADAARFQADFAAWEKKYGRVDPGNKGYKQGWAATGFDTADWKPITMPGDWTNLDVPNGGVIWLRKKLMVAPQFAGKDMRINLDVVSDFDTTYFNGEEVGHGGMTPPYFWASPRSYVVPGKLVKAGENLLAIRVVSPNPKNRLFGVADHLSPAIDPATVPPVWLSRVETAFEPRSSEALAAEPKPPTAQLYQTPSTVYNGMIWPLIPYGIKGVIWYQAENNVTRGYNYRTLFPKLIESWRSQWGLGDFPFYFVQLPNYGRPPNHPNDPPGWAEIRESQLRTWQTVPRTGMAVAIDVGEANDIHPKNKLPVGERLARFALANGYGKSLEDSGPVYQSMTIDGDKVDLHFSHIGTGLMAKGGEPLRMFTVAGADHNFVWADAIIQGNEVIVSSKDVPLPVAVRYAWFSDPEGLNLYNEEGLPASPFRTDDWPSKTEGIWWLTGAQQTAP